MNYKVIIPARLGSTRLPGKPLKEINGKTLIQRVVDQVKKSSADSIYVATDSIDIIDHCDQHQISTLLTSKEHQTGSDRLAEACNLLNLEDETLIVNVQGDEPFIDPRDIDNLAMLASNKVSNMTTLFSSLKDQELNDESVVKLWLNTEGRVEEFSRSVGSRNSIKAKKHIGLYCYRAHFLRTFVKWKQTSNEIERSLEQMRAMDNGEAIYALESVGKYHLGVDTESDLNIAIEISKNIE